MTIYIESVDGHEEYVANLDISNPSIAEQLLTNFGGVRGADFEPLGFSEAEPIEMYSNYMVWMEVYVNVQGGPFYVSATKSTLTFEGETGDGMGNPSGDLMANYYHETVMNLHNMVKLNPTSTQTLDTSDVLGEKDGKWCYYKSGASSGKITGENIDGMLLRVSLSVELATQGGYSTFHKIIHIKLTVDDYTTGSVHAEIVNIDAETFWNGDESPTTDNIIHAPDSKDYVTDNSISVAAVYLYYDTTYDPDAYEAIQRSCEVPLSSSYYSVVSFYETYNIRIEFDYYRYGVESVPGFMEEDSGFKRAKLVIDNLAGGDYGLGMRYVYILCIGMIVGGLALAWGPDRTVRYFTVNPMITVALVIAVILGFWLFPALGGY
jgi:hypothetical protein